MQTRIQRTSLLALCAALAATLPACEPSSPGSESSTSDSDTDQDGNDSGPGTGSTTSSTSGGAEETSDSEESGSSTGTDTKGTSGTEKTDSSTGTDTKDNDATGEPDIDPNMLKLIKSKLDRIKDPKVSEKNQELLKNGNLDLSFELLRNTGKEDTENVAVSAVSVRAAFGMIHAMAAGDTQREIASALHFPSDPKIAQTGLNYIDQTLKSRQLEKNKTSSPVKLNTANRVFVSDDITPGQDYLDTLAQHYGTGVYATNFAKDPEKARALINQQVSDQTEGKIPDLFPEGYISERTEWVITNAIHFKAPWAGEMDDDDEMSFTRLDGSKLKVPELSSGDIKGMYGVTDNFKWAQVPLRGEKLSALVLVPNEGKFAQVQKELSAKTIHAMFEGGQKDKISVTIPAFKVQTGSMDYTDYLSTTMPSAFSSADFSGFGKSSLGPITAVLHSVFLAADGKGIEAAAATGASSDKSDDGPNFSLTANRPFFFLVHDRPSGLILFAGRVMDPGTAKE